MKNNFKKIVACGVVFLMLFTTVAVFAAGGVYETISVLKNQVNIAIKGEVVGEVGESYTLDKGDEVPYSIVYKGTTYLPIRKVAELLEMEVTWDGETSTAGVKTTKTEESKEEGTEGSEDISEEPLFAEETSISNPADIDVLVGNVVADYSDMYGNVYTIVDKNIIRGDEAYNIVMGWNQYNDIPSSGMEYMLVPISIAYYAGDDYKFKSLDVFFDMNFDVFSGITKSRYPNISTVVEENLDVEDSEIYDGGLATGYLCFIVSIEDDSPILRVDPNYGELYSWHKLY